MGTALVDARANRTTKKEQPYQLSNRDLCPSWPHTTNLFQTHLLLLVTCLHLENSCVFNSITLYKGP